MKSAIPHNECKLWKKETLFDIDFASYTLSHHSFARHFHDHYVIELVLEGVDQFYCNGVTHTAIPGQMALINPGEVHTGSTVADTALRYFSLYPHVAAIEKAAENLEITLPPNFAFQKPVMNNSLLTEKFNLLASSFYDSKDPLQQEELFFDCLYELLKSSFIQHREPKLTNCNRDSRIQLLIEYIRTHFRESVSLAQMAELVCLNPCHLVRLFRKSTGLSPYEYLLVTRTEYARQLLRKGKPVNEAALKAGFYDASHFNRIFSKIAGTSPKFFRS